MRGAVAKLTMLYGFIWFYFLLLKSNKTHQTINARGARERANKGLLTHPCRDISIAISARISTHIK